MVSLEIQTKGVHHIETSADLDDGIVRNGVQSNGIQASNRRRWVCVCVCFRLSLGEGVELETKIKPAVAFQKESPPKIWATMYLTPSKNGS